MFFYDYIENLGVVGYVCFGGWYEFGIEDGRNVVVFEELFDVFGWFFG